MGGAPTVDRRAGWCRLGRLNNALGVIPWCGPCNMARNSCPSQADSPGFLPFQGEPPI